MKFIKDKLNNKATKIVTNLNEPVIQLKINLLIFFKPNNLTKNV